VNYQDREKLKEIINEVKITGREYKVCLDDVSICMFRNLYNTAKYLEPDLTIKILEVGYSFKIMRQQGDSK
jgi:hypothetical protein